MAFYDQEEENFELDPNQGFQIGGPAGSFSAGAPGGASAGGGKSPDKPGNFVGIKQYLDANKNQANQFGEQVGGKISSAIEGAQGQVSGLQNQFKDVANQGLIKGFETAQNEATGITNKAATGGPGELPTMEEKSRFGEIANAQYKGPKSVQETEVYNPVYQSVQEAQKLADLSKSEEGSQELARSVASKQSPYTTGAARLDSYLLNTDENKQRLENARKNAEMLQPSLNEAVASSNQFAKGLQTQTDELRNNVRNLFSNTAMGKRAGVQSALDQQKAAIEANNQKIQQYRNLLADTSDAGSIGLTPAQMQELGLQENQRLYGALNTDPNAFLPGEQVFDPNTAIAREEQARLAALAELAGTYGGDFANPYTQTELAGTFGGLSKIDPSKLQSEISKRQQSYQQSYSNDRLRGELGITNPSNPGYTPEYLENVLIPLYAQSGSGAGQQVARQYQNALNNWKNRFNFNDIVRKV